MLACHGGPHGGDLCIQAAARTEHVWFGGAAILDGSRCNASVTSGYGTPPREQAVGSQPFGLAVNQQANTVYVTEAFQAGSMSILDATRH